MVLKTTTLLLHNIIKQGLSLLFLIERPLFVEVNMLFVVMIIWNLRTWKIQDSSTVGIFLFKTFVYSLFPPEIIFWQYHLKAVATWQLIIRKSCSGNRFLMINDLFYGASVSMKFLEADFPSVGMIGNQQVPEKLEIKSKYLRSVIVFTKHAKWSHPMTFWVE